MPKIMFIEYNGTEHVVEAVVGRSLMQAAVDHMVPGIVADCGGSCSCATCHGFIGQQWLIAIPAAQADESSMLEGLLETQDNSRLTCQIEITPALDGLTVLDLTRVVAGPYCTMLLADMGARVIKIEQPGRGDPTRGWGPPFLNGESAYFLSVNRNKESVTLDFKRPEGRAIFDQLIARSDVVVENFRPGKLAKLGLDYATLGPLHPRLVYCSVSGFGR